MIKDDVNTIQLNPMLEEERSVGLKNQMFLSKKGSLNVYLTSKYLTMNNTYNASVVCTDGSEVLEVNYDIQPIYRNLDYIPARSVWVKDNMVYFIGVVLIIILLIAIISVLRGA